MLKGYITNLGKYNEGQLIGKWVEFPLMEDELEEAKEEIGINEFYEEYFFTDWENDWGIDPFKEWGEYPDIDEVNTIVEELEYIDNCRNLEWLWAYWEYQGGSLYDAVMNYENNSCFIGDDSYGIVEDTLQSQYGVEDHALNVIMNCLDVEQFMEEYVGAYNSEYGYILCF